MSSLRLKVLQGAQLIAVASSDPAATGVDGSPLQGSDIQVQYVQLAPVTDHTAAAQVGPPFGKCAGPGAPAGVDTLGPFYLGPSSVRKVSDRERCPCGPRRSLGILSLVSAWKCEGEKSVPGPGTSLKPVLELLSGTCLPMSLETKSSAPEALLFLRSGQGRPRVRGPAGPRVGL